MRFYDMDSLPDHVDCGLVLTGSILYTPRTLELGNAGTVRAWFDGSPTVAGILIDADATLLKALSDRVSPTLAGVLVCELSQLSETRRLIGNTRPPAVHEDHEAAIAAITKDGGLVHFVSLFADGQIQAFERRDPHTLSGDLEPVLWINDMRQNTAIKAPTDYFYFLADATLWSCDLEDYLDGTVRRTPGQFDFYVMNYAYLKRKGGPAFQGVL